MNPRFANPTREDLVQFSRIFGIGLPLVFGLAFPLLGDGSLPLWPWLVGLAFLVWGWVRPMSLKGPFRVWIRFAHALGRVMTPILLTITWLVAIVPTGLVMRLVGNDPMRRRWDEDSPSYRRPVEERDPSHMERPF